MEIFKILEPKIQEFITDNIGANLKVLAFQKNKFPEIDYKIILQQIEAKARCQHKLPTWFETKNIIYPSKVSIEQTSSEKTAQIKSQLVSGKTILDITGGFGVDSYYFSKKFSQVVHCEINEELSKIVAHNYAEMQIQNICCLTGDGNTILENSNQKFDCIYIDPSRRNDAKGKVFMLEDCLPNVPKLLPFYFKYCNTILIKVAPILDISAGILELQNVKTIYIIAVENEVKEVLFKLEKEFTKNYSIKTINSTKTNTQIFDFEFNNNKNCNFSLPQKYLYEPNAAIMKSGGFAEVALQYNLNKLGVHSHLYTSDFLKEFPGRVFTINLVFEYSKKEMKKHLENKKANITTRNFPESVENIRKKWKIKDGGEEYYFFTTNTLNEKIVLACKKINANNSI